MILVATQQVVEAAQRVWPGAQVDVFRVSFLDHMVDECIGYAVGYWVRVLRNDNYIVGRAYVGEEYEEGAAIEAAIKAAKAGITKCPPRMAAGALWLFV